MWEKKYRVMYCRLVSIALLLCLCVLPGVNMPAYAQSTSLDTDTLLDSRFGAGAGEGVETFGQDLGIGWSRVPIDIDENNYNNIEYLKMRGVYIGSLQQKGIMPYMVINPRKQNQWVTAAQYAQAVATIVESFDMDGNSDASGLIYPVYIYELINEYDSQGGTYYPGLSNSAFVAMFSQGMQAARQAFSDCRIAYNPFPYNESDAQSLIQQVGVDQIDIVSYHTYFPVDNPEDASSPSYFTNFATMLNRLGLTGKPVWVTEYACYDHQGMTPPPNYQAAGDQEDNARWLIQTAVWGLGSGFFNKLIYTEIGQSQDMNSDACLIWMTMLDSSGNKRPNYYAYQKIIDMIDHFTSVGSLSLGENIYGYSFIKSDGKVVDILWSKEGTGSKSNVQISGLGSGEVTVTEAVPDDNSGTFQVTQKTIANGVLRFSTLTEEPVYVELSAEQANPAQLPDAPTVPANLRLSSSSSSHITIAWDASSAATGIGEYIVKMKTGSGDFVEMGTTNSSTCQFSCSNLSPETSYTFRVRAMEGSGSGVVSDWSQELTVTTPAAEVWSEPFAEKIQQPVDKIWEIKFSLPVGEDTIDGNIYVATDLQGQNKLSTVVPILSLDDSRQVDIAYPSGGWSKGMGYYIFINDQVASASGQNLSEGIRFKFTIAN